MGLKDFIKKIFVSGSINNKNDSDSQIYISKSESDNSSRNFQIKSKSDESINVNVSININKEIRELPFYGMNYEYLGKNEYGEYVYEHTDSNGLKEKVESNEGPKNYRKDLVELKIQREIPYLTFEFEGRNYNRDELKNLYDEVSKIDPPNYIRNERPDILNDEHLTNDEIEEVRKLKKGQEAKKWMSRIRSQRRKGKLDQYQIDSLNKLGMIWNPNSSSGSKDEWENNYISFKKHGLSYEIKDWVKEQRLLYHENEIPNENLYRLQAVNFPFESTKNEKYVLTRKTCWELREKLEKKIERHQVKEEKKYEIYEKEKKLYATKKQEQRAKEHNKEVNGFYSRKYSYCDPSSINKLNQDQALEDISNLNKGYSYESKRLKEFLEIETKKFKNKNKNVPHYINQFKSDIKIERLSDDEIYDELSNFNNNIIKTEIRKQACHYMLRYTSSRSLKSTKFKEVDYLISIYKKEKNITELVFLRDFFKKYPLLNELYSEKINTEIIKLSKK